jgi:pyridoxamine 5'-phosphate oxidase
MLSSMNPNASEGRPDLLDVASFRRDYHHAELRRSDLDPDPIVQFHAWLDEAAACPAILEPTAMVLSTALAGGEVSSRVVLLKGYDATGFRFFTNTGSRKASQIASNASVSLLFYWEALERQIQINGATSLLPRSETEAYFASRPRGSRIGAWASRQSEVLPDRGTLDRRAEDLAERFAGVEVPVPEFWSGYLVTPRTVEFWQGRPNRLHDRFLYRTRGGEDGAVWTIERLSP